MKNHLGVLITVLTVKKQSFPDFRCQETEKKWKTEDTLARKNKEK